MIQAPCPLLKSLVRPMSQPSAPKYASTAASLAIASRPARLGTYA